MLTKKRQQRFLHEKERRWLEQLEAFGATHDEEALHRLRVEIKKIRALVRLTSAQSDKGAAGHFHGLKKMFRQAGMIRDAGTQVRFLEQRHFLSAEQYQRQAAIIRTAADSFAGLIGRYRRTGKKASRRILTDVHDIQAAKVQEWFAREIIRTGILLMGEGGTLHAARKKIKTLLYVYKLLPTAIAARVRLHADYLDRLQDAIGQWHDAYVAGTGAAVDNERIVKALSETFFLEVHQN